LRDCIDWDNGMAGGEPIGVVNSPEISVLKLFPTPVYVATLPGYEALNVELRRIILEREQSSEGVERSNRGGWQSSWDMYEWGGEPIRRVLDFARAIVDRATVDRAGQHHKIAWRINCWANVNRTGHSNQLHTHPGGLWSVSYYVDDGGVDADRTLGGEFEIADPRGAATVMYAPQLTFMGEDGPGLGETQRLTPRDGAMIVFPSWLLHGVCPYRGNRERISIAINFSLANA
jgi:uncharacterized protein (TIGR02466 family)